jgi:hypothetical protein
VIAAPPSLQFAAAEVWPIHGGRRGIKIVVMQVTRTSLDTNQAFQRFSN